MKLPWDTFLLSQIIDSLPTRRDWLDPDLEKLCCEAIATAKAAPETQEVAK